MKNFKQKIHEIVFEADTKFGKAFDVVLLVIICLSIILVMIASVDSYNEKYGHILLILEWSLTVLFTFEYFLRIWLVKRPSAYIFSFFGIVDFLSIVPAYLGIFFTGPSGFVIIRMLRLMRVFRIFKLGRFIGEGNQILVALKASRAKITVFITAVLVLATILGTIMYLIEGSENNFDNIPKSIYWAIVTLTTVGYGDISPHTPVGQAIASVVMILGYGIIAVPTGIVTNELMKTETNTILNTQSCMTCGHDSHDNDARFCKKCGSNLNT